MPTANDISLALAESLGKKPSTVEAYGLALRQRGWWPATKRGRGADAITELSASKLALALLSDGPTQLAGFFIPYSNLVPLEETAPLVRLMRQELDLEPDAKFLEYMAGFVRIYAKGETNRLIYHSPDPEGLLDEFEYDGPQVEFRIKGPLPIGSIKFNPSNEALDKLKHLGAEDIEPGPRLLPFVDYTYRIRDIAVRDGFPLDGFDAAITQLREKHSRGIGWERYLTGREISAIAKEFKTKD